MCGCLAGLTSILNSIFLREFKKSSLYIKSLSEEHLEFVPIYR
jgi:hypothetical protein